MGATTARSSASASLGRVSPTSTSMSTRRPRSAATASGAV
jgi:hypothetical protein